MKALFSITCFREHSNLNYTRVDLVLMRNNFFFSSKSRYENKYMVIDPSKINSFLATTSVISALNQPIQVTYSSILIT